MAKKLTINKKTTDVRLTNIIKVACDWVDPQILAIVGGRGTSKSQEIQAERIIKVVEDMPGAPLALVAKSYNDLTFNILPSIKTGLLRKGYIEGIHYVSRTRPPKQWTEKCSVIIDDYKHAHVFWNGAVLFEGSLDTPSLLAGKSVVHIFSDESKYQSDKKIDSAIPTLRGDITRFGHSVYFLGLTITTDMPNVSEGEYDWIFRFAKNMDKERIGMIISCFEILNDFRIQYYIELNGKNREKKLEQLEKQITMWYMRWCKLRYGQTFFLNASSLANIQNLTFGYIKNLVKSLGTEEFNKSVIGIRPTLKKSMRFYPLLSEGHFYYDGLDNNFYQRYSYTDKIDIDSRALKYCNPDQKLEGGLDVGNMKSFVIGQPDEQIYRLLKFHYTVPPHSFRELADQFVNFFRFHNKKEIDLYYDRAANNAQQMGEDDASKIKVCIEKDLNGNRTGWVVNLMSRKQGNIGQNVEYEFMIEMLKGETQGLPKLLIDSTNCKEIRASMENARAIIKYHKGIKQVHKCKKSEKLPIDKLAMNSTNPSDAVKYLLCRKNWISLTKAKNKLKVMVFLNH